MPYACVCEPSITVMEDKLSDKGREKRMVTKHIIGCTKVNDPRTQG